MAEAGKRNSVAAAGVRHRPARAGLRYERVPMLGLAVLALLAALWSGLLRLGWRLPAIQPGLYVNHGPLMVCGFLGTLISLERAVALDEAWCYAAPLLSGLGALALIAGVRDPVGPILITLGSLGLVANFIAIVRRQTTLFTITMALGALLWLAGNCLWLRGVPIMNMFAWWAGFLVLTIAGERLELSRLTGLDRNRPLFISGVGALIAGLVVGWHNQPLGFRLGGLGLFVLAVWLWRYDLARRTVKLGGLTRFIAANLLGGYFWLGVGAVAWIGFGGDLKVFHYDVMLHAVFIGFVFSMIFAHAPIIFPSVLGKPLPYRKAFYAHSALLHLSLLIRVSGDLAGSYSAYSWGGFLNVIALLLFLGNSGLAILSASAESGAKVIQPSGLSVE